MRSSSKTERLWNAGARAVFGAGLIGAFFLIPLNLHADIFSFSSITKTMGKIAKIEKKISAEQASMDNYKSHVVAPLGQLNSMRGWLSESEAKYAGWSQSVEKVPIKSATLGSASRFERELLAGTSGNTSASTSGSSDGSTSGTTSGSAGGGNGAAIPSTFSSVYGAEPAADTITPAIAQAVDTTDAGAKAAMTLATKSDSAAETLLKSAKTLATSAGASTPGTAGLVGAEAAALNLNAQAMQQHVLAALIRQMSARLASRSAQVKNATENHHNALEATLAGTN